MIDLSTVGPASRCTAALRDLGATVTKVLAPEGKQIEPPFFAYGAGRGMTKVRVDLKAEDGLADFLLLCEDADVLVESYRPGVAARLGIGYEAVRDVSPLIVYASLSGYGQDGPYAQWAGHDINYLAAGGFLAPYFLTGQEVDLSTRLLKAGWVVRYLPTAAFNHLRGSVERQPGTALTSIT